MKNKIPGIFIFIIIANILGILLSLRDIIPGNQIIIGIYALKGFPALLYRIIEDLFSIIIILFILFKFKYTMVIYYSLFSIGLLLSLFNLFCILFLKDQFLENIVITNPSDTMKTTAIIFYFVRVLIGVIISIIMFIFIRKKGDYFKVKTTSSNSAQPASAQ